MRPNVRPDADDAGLWGSAEPVAPPRLNADALEVARRVLHREMNGEPGDAVAACISAYLAAVARAPQGDPPGQIIEIDKAGRVVPKRKSTVLLHPEPECLGHREAGPPPQEQETRGSGQGLAHFLAHARRVAAEVLRFHPTPNDGAKGSIESEAAHVIRQLVDTVESAPARFELVPAPQGDAAPPQLAFAALRILEAVGDYYEDEPDERRVGCDQCCDTSLTVGDLRYLRAALRGGASSSGSAPLKSGETRP